MHMTQDFRTHTNRNCNYLGYVRDIDFHYIIPSHFITTKNIADLPILKFHFLLANLGGSTKLKAIFNRACLAESNLHQ